MGQVLQDVGDVLEKYYPLAGEGLEDDCFINANGVVFKICAFPDEKVIFMDYADNIDAAKKGLFEEGDGFPTNMKIEELINALRKDIDSQL